MGWHYTLVYEVDRLWLLLLNLNNNLNLNNLRTAELKGTLWIIDSSPCQGGTVGNRTPNLCLPSQIPKPPSSSTGSSLLSWQLIGVIWCIGADPWWGRKAFSLIPCNLIPSSSDTMGDSGGWGTDRVGPDWVDCQSLSHVNLRGVPHPSVHIVGQQPHGYPVMRWDDGDRMTGGLSNLRSAP